MDARSQRRLIWVVSLLTFGAACGLAAAGTVTWTGTIGPYWNTGGNWSGGSPPGNNDDVLFNNLSTANLATNNDISNLTLAGIAVINPSAAVSIAGNALTIGAGGIDMSTATQNLSITAPLTLTGTLSLNVGAGRTLTTGTPTLQTGSVVSKDGAGNYSPGNFYVGDNRTSTFVMNAGTMNTGEFRFGQGASGVGTVVQTGGTITNSGNFIVGGITAATGGRGIYQISGGSLTTGMLYCAWTQNGEIYQTGGSITTTNMDSATDGGNGYYELHAGTLTINGTANFAYTNGYRTDFIQSGGTASFRYLRMGGLRAGSGNAVANYTINNTEGSSVLQIGRSGAPGELNLGHNNNGVGTLNVVGGTVDATYGNIFLGGLSATTSGTINQTGGQVTIGPGYALKFGNGSAATGTYNLNGGTLTLSSITYTNLPTQTFNFGGGTLQANGALNTDMPMTVNSGGAIVDTNGFDVTLSGALTGAGGLTKQGAGTLTLSGGGNLGGTVSAAAGTLVKSGSGALSCGSLFVGDHVTSALTIESGTLTVSNFRFGDHEASPVVGTVNQTGGSVSAGIFIAGGIGYPQAQGQGKGVYNLSGGSLSTPTFYVGWTDRGEVYQTGGTVTVTNLESATDGPGGGRYELGGTGQLTVNGTARLGYRFQSDFLQTGGTASINNLMLGGGYSVAGTGNYTISGTGQLTIASGGSFLVGGNNGGTGNFNVQGGTTVVHADLSVGAAANTNGTVTQTGGTVTIDPANALRFGSTGSYSATYNLNGGVLTLANIVHSDPATQKFNFGGGTLRANGNLATSMPMTVNTGGATVDTSGYDVTFSGALSGSGSLTKVGAGSLTLTNGSVGTITISAGELVKDTSGALAVTGGNLNVPSGGTLTHRAGTTTISGAYGVYVTGTGSGGGVVNHTGGTIRTTGLYCIVGAGGGKATYNLSGGTLDVAGRLYSAWTGNAEINQTGGSITAANFDSATDGGNGTVNLSGGTFTINGTATFGYRSPLTGVMNQSGGVATFTNLYLGGGAASAGTGNYTLSGSGQLNLTLGGSFFVGYNNGGTGNFNVNGGTANLQGNLFVGGAATTTGTVTQTAGNVTISPAYALRFGNAAAATGTYNLNGGVLTLANIAYSDPAKQHFNFGGGTLRANGPLNTNMPMTFNAGGATVDTNGNDVTLAGALAGAGGLTKDGLGTLTLTLAGPYGGNTTVKNGTLALGASASIASSPVIDVQTGATLNVAAVSGGFQLASGQTLKGTGTVQGNMTVGSGAIHAPGASPGIQTINGDYTLAAGSTLRIDLAGTTPGDLYDQVRVNGQVSLAGLLDLDLGFDPGLGDGFTIIANDGVDAVLGQFEGLPEGSFLMASHGPNVFRFLVSYQGNDGNDVTLTNPYPEPSSLAILVIGGVALVGYRRFRGCGTTPSRRALG